MPLFLSAPKPADEINLPDNFCLKIRSAVGLRQILPTQTTRILLKISGLPWKKKRCFILHDLEG
jgi:hypothetical protein